MPALTAIAVRVTEAAARNVPGADVRVAVLPDLALPEGATDAVTGNFAITGAGPRHRRHRGGGRALAG